MGNKHSVDWYEGALEEHRAYCTNCSEDKRCERFKYLLFERIDCVIAKEKVEKVKESQITCSSGTRCSIYGINS